MKPPTFVRTLSDEERQALKAGLRSPDAFTLRRCQALLQSADGCRPGEIAAAVGCCVQSVRNAIRSFQAEGVACIREKSSRPKQTRSVLDDAGRRRLREMLHRSPRDFGKATSLWT
ncbi:helix-turn-helix domain-containing protein, partial [Bradyrhizobium sp. NBAIM08]|uniref:helix-turn-helix domain-containing protein n=1 Tax=Bradyrhizobium sp. NBAIM08 TaxID=2793815 RepID=UPI001CD79FE2